MGVLVTVILPLGLAIIMLSLGLGLTFSETGTAGHTDKTVCKLGVLLCFDGITWFYPHCLLR